MGDVGIDESETKKSSHIVYCSRVDKMRSASLQRIRTFLSTVFQEDEDKDNDDDNSIYPILDDEIIFWIQDRTKIISVAILDCNYSAQHLLEPYDFNCEKLKLQTINLIHSVSTLDEERGKGCATAIVQQVIAYAERRPEINDRLFLEVDRSNKLAIRLYEKLGFKLFTNDASSSDIDVDVGTNSGLPLLLSLTLPSRKVIKERFVLE